MEAPGRHAKDCIGKPVYPDGHADNIALAAESPLPAVIAQHSKRTGSGVLIVLLMKEPTHGWRETEHIKVIAGNDVTPRTSGSSGIQTHWLEAVCS